MNSNQNPTITVGTILRASWGYEQTNVDYFQVVGLTAQRVKVRPIAQLVVRPDTDMTEYVVPVADKFTGPAITRKAERWKDRHMIRIDSFTVASTWSGRPDYQSHTR